MHYFFVIEFIHYTLSSIEILSLSSNFFWTIVSPIWLTYLIAKQLPPLSQQYRMSSDKPLREQECKRKKIDFNQVSGLFHRFLFLDFFKYFFCVEFVSLESHFAWTHIFFYFEVWSFIFKLHHIIYFILFRYHFW